MLKEQVRQAGKIYYLPLEITNQGDLAAEEVMIMVRLTSTESGDDQPEPEEKQVTIGLLSGGSTADAVLAFKNDPSKGQLEAEVVSYVKP